jgi:class 3 adenylate cyclase
VGIVESGCLAVELEDGSIFEIKKGQVFDIAPGHDAWVVGDEKVVTVEWVGQQSWLQAKHSDRVLATLLFTDIVDSTARAGTLGDAPWRQLLDQHDRAIRQVMSQTQGHEIKRTGDGFLIRFPGPAQALDAARRNRKALESLDVQIRQGIHVGEVEFHGGDLAGVAVHEAARVMAQAGANEIVVSAIVLTLAPGSSPDFKSLGPKHLKGIEGPRELFLLAD